jgi:hypothetical protein
MYLAIITLPLLGSIVSGFFGRKVGVSGAQLITCTSVIVTTLLAIVAFFEVGLNNIPVSINLFRWIDSESLNVLWGFHFDSLTVSMLIPVLIVSSLVHIYSIGYMSHDPHNQRFFSYLSLFTFMMIILVTANNFLLMFVGWEGVGICSYLLVSFWFTRIAANQSSMSAFLTNRVGDCFLTIGMFAILWSFGKNKKMFKYSNRVWFNYNIPTIAYRQTRNCSYNSCFDNIGSYLAGLIEGDGHIAVHDKNSKSKVYRPKIIIVFNVHDKPLAEKLSAGLKVGKVIDKSSAGHVLLQILAKQEVLKIINLINGRMRTPKIEALHRAISWINEKDNSFIPFLGLDKSSIDSNSWLAGFTDADGNFSITVYDRKKENKVLRTSVQTFFRIEVKQNYSRDVGADQGGASYFNIMTKIAEFFTVNLYTRTRTVDDRVYYAFMAISHNWRGHDLARNYFNRFPLYSSKYLAYKDWCRVQDLHRGISLSKESLNEIKIIKNQFNSKRKVYDFSHLDSLTF